MAHIGIDIERIRKCVDVLVLKAKDEIPLMPAETQTIKHFPIQLDLYIDEIPFVFSLSCSPPLVSDNYKSMLISCVVTIPGFGIAVERPSMYKSVEKILLELETDLVKDNLTSDFNDLIKDIDFNYGHLIL